MLPDVPGRPAHARGRLQTSNAVVVDRVDRNAGHRLVGGIVGAGHDYLRAVHAFVRNAITIRTVKS